MIGFGWTNAAFLVFLHELPKDFVDRLAKEQTGSSRMSRGPIPLQNSADSSCREGLSLLRLYENSFVRSLLLGVAAFL